MPVLLRSEAGRREAEAHLQADQAARFAEGQRERAEQGEQRAKASELAARQIAYASDMNRLQQALAEHNLRQARELLDRHRPKEGQNDLRGWEWRYLWRRCRGDMEATLCQQAIPLFYAGFVRDGTRVATFDDAGRVSLWDVAKRTQVGRLQDQTQEESVVANSGQARLSSDGELLAARSRGQDGKASIKVWKLSAGEVMAEFPCGEALVTSLALSPNNQNLAAFIRNEAVRVWNFGTRELKLQLPVSFDNSHSRGAVAFSPNSTVLAIGDADGRIRLADVAMGTESAAFIASTNSGVVTLAFSPDGRLLAAGALSVDTLITLWDVSTGTKLRDLPGHKGFITSLAFSPDGGTLASASADTTIKLWNVSTWAERATLLGHEDEVWSVTFSKDGQALASAGKDGAVRIWSTAKDRPSEVALTVASGGWAWALSPDSATVAVIGTDGVISLWDLVSGQKKGALSALGTGNVAVFWASAAEILAASSEPPEVKAWNLANAALTRFPLHLSGPPKHWRLLPTTGKMLIGCTSPGPTNWTFTCWDLRTHAEVLSLRVEKDVTQIAVSPDECSLAVGTWQGEVSVANLGTGLQGPWFKAHPQQVQCLAFLRVSRFLVTAGGDPTPKVWDLTTRVEVTRLRAHNLPITSRGLSVSPDDSRMATASMGLEPVIIWDTGSWEQVANISVDATQLIYPRFLADGNGLAVMDANLTFHVWRAPSWDEIATAEKAEGKAQ